MEKVSATCCMEWSIELEKALRSNAPGRPVKAILQVGRRLEHWNREAQPTMSVYNLYGLVPGEDRLFANAILLRLAEAFVSKQRDVKLAVVRAFMGLRKSCKKGRNKLKNGILSKNRVSNYAELMRSVKVVFDSGNTESRAMALVLFGCWADFAKDSAHIRYLILSNVVSSEVYLAKAALFAAGCFCELSTDFAAVVLEMLVNLVTSSDIPPAIRWCGVRTFSRMECSPLVADRAYKTGLELLVDSSDEDFLAKMLVPLSKLAGISPLHASEQVQLLFSFLSEGKTLKLQETSLRCLCHMVTGGGHHLLDSTCAKSLFKIVNGSEFPVPLQCEALKILNQATLYSLLNISEVDMSELDKLLSFTKTAECLVESKNLLAVRLLANVCSKISGTAEMERPEGFSSLPQDVASSLVDRVILLLRPLLDVSQDDPATSFVEIQTALHLLLQIVGNHVDLGVLLLDKLNLVITHLVNEHEKEGLLKEKFIRVSSKLLLVLYRFLEALLETLNEVDAVSVQIFEKLKGLVQCINNCKLFPFCIPTLYSLLLHSQMIWSGMVKEKEEFNENISYDYWIESETFTLMCAQKMLIERDYWSAYRVGTQAACDGAWCTATFIFANLITQVRTPSCYYWLKSLAHLSIAEMKIQLLVLPNQGSSRTVECLELIKLPETLFKDEMAEIGKCITEHEKLFGTNSSMSLQRETLHSMSSASFYFQKWFLALRARLLEGVIEIINFSAAEATAHKMVGCTETLQKFTQLSVKFKRLADEFDLMVASFIGMDRKSSKVISALALGCSLVSFTAGFALFIPNLPGYETSPLSGAVLIQNLLGRLSRHLDDDETSISLYALADDDGFRPKSGFHFHSKTAGTGIGCEARRVLSLYRSAVSGVVHLKNQAAEGIDKEKLMSHVTENGQRILLETATAWMQIPFGTPKYLFKTRPCIGSELFAVNSNTRQQSRGISISQGFCLSLDLCVQMRNNPVNLLVQPIKLHCIICCSVSFQGQSTGDGSSHPWEADDMLRMNEKLHHHVTKRGTKNGDRYTRVGGEGVEAFVGFEPNVRGQGFSSCLLDVSGFPVGTYRMKWHSCCVDGRGSYWSLIPLNEGSVFTVT